MTLLYVVNVRRHKYMDQI